MICLHHNDDDGRCAAAIVYRRYPECRFHEIDYGQSVPLHEIRWSEAVWIVDFSLQAAGDWDRLFDISTDIIWIDHHETAIARAPEWAGRRHGIIETGACAALLTWRYIYPSAQVPEVVRLIDQWDRWVHNDDPVVLNFIAGLKTEDTSPKSPVWDALLSPGDHNNVLRDTIMRNGMTIRRLWAVEDAAAVRRNAYPIAFHGHSAIVLHTTKSGSKQFESVRQYEIFIAAEYDGHQWTVHMYSDTVKVNDIAVQYGGGGHPGAAGFQCVKLPWAA